MELLLHNGRSHSREGKKSSGQLMNEIVLFVSCYYATIITVYRQVDDWFNKTEILSPVGAYWNSFLKNLIGFLEYSFHSSWKKLCLYLCTQGWVRTKVCLSIILTYM